MKVLPPIIRITSQITGLSSKRKLPRRRQWPLRTRRIQKHSSRTLKRNGEQRNFIRSRAAKRNLRKLETTLIIFLGLFPAISRIAPGSPAWNPIPDANEGNAEGGLRMLAPEIKSSTPTLPEAARDQITTYEQVICMHPGNAVQAVNGNCGPYRGWALEGLFCVPCSFS